MTYVHLVGELVKGTVLTSKKISVALTGVSRSQVVRKGYARDLLS